MKNIHELCAEASEIISSDSNAMSKRGGRLAMEHVGREGKLMPVIFVELSPGSMSRDHIVYGLWDQHEFEAILAEHSSQL